MLKAIAIIAAVLAIGIAAHDMIEFTLAPQGDAMLFGWAMYGPAPLMSGLMQVFINPAGAIGRDFVAGLVNQNRLTEK